MAKLLTLKLSHLAASWISLRSRVWLSFWNMSESFREVFTFWCLQAGKIEEGLSSSLLRVNRIQFWAHRWLLASSRAFPSLTSLGQPLPKSSKCLLFTQPATCSNPCGTHKFLQPLPIQKGRQTLLWSRFPPPLRLPFPIYLRFCAAEVLALLVPLNAAVTKPTCLQGKSSQHLPHTTASPCSDC